LFKIDKKSDKQYNIVKKNFFYKYNNKMVQKIKKTKKTKKTKKKKTKKT
jgi:hypothetical protein